MKMTVHARVKNGRLLADEPTDLPEGTELELVPAYPDDEAWELTPEQEAKVRESIAQAKRGELIPAEDVLRELRSQR
jgi:hypothetical protein